MVPMLVVKTGFLRVDSLAEKMEAELVSHWADQSGNLMDNEWVLQKAD